MNFEGLLRKLVMHLHNFYAGRVLRPLFLLRYFLPHYLVLCYVGTESHIDPQNI